MTQQKKQIFTTTAASVAAIMLITLVIWRIAFSTPAAKFQPQSQTNNKEHTQSAAPTENKKESAKTTKEKSEKADTALKAEPELSLKDIIKAARTWGPAYTVWYGKKAPDFTLTDINGKEHKLSDYRGKDVIIIFWASWCGPCIMEVPHLIALRNTVSEDKLAMLAVSNEKLAQVKKFAAGRKINYTVLAAGTTDMPAPYDEIRSIPCSFFIDSEGKIKLVTNGLVSLPEIKAILRAK